MSYVTSILADNPLAYWRMNESSGIIMRDSTANGYDATLSGTFTLGQPGPILGLADTAVLLDGATGALSAPYSLNDTTLSALTLEFWINAGAAWQYVAVTYDGTAVQLYLNGVPAAADHAATVVTIGELFDYAGSFLSGSMGQVALYPRALNAASIAAHYGTAGYTHGASVLIASAIRRSGLTGSAIRRDGMTPDERRRD